jgi:hypothetical protein
MQGKMVWELKREEKRGKKEEMGMNMCVCGSGSVCVRRGEIFVRVWLYFGVGKQAVCVERNVCVCVLGY